MGFEVLLYIPNIIGYIRIILLIAAWFCYATNPVWFIILYLTNVILDGIDGAIARKLNQTSAFGAWFDVVIDCVGRSMLWSRLYSWGSLIASLEWLVFVCTHSIGAQWKASFVQAPWIAQKVMEKNFKTPLGTYVVLGLHILPLWLYAHYAGIFTHTLVIPKIIDYMVIGLLSGGRAIAAVVEMYCLWAHIRYLLRDPDAKDEQK
ncbi:uncharacterized protein [Amphiura filiformis]|uniref:uncharacterized protein n=1 Tax=Amphiura filiformis TaxID=82378 RepID=UPI003B20FFF6